MILKEKKAVASIMPNTAAVHIDIYRESGINSSVSFTIVESLGILPSAKHVT